MGDKKKKKFNPNHFTKEAADRVMKASEDPYRGPDDEDEYKYNIKEVND